MFSFLCLIILLAVPLQGQQCDERCQLETQLAKECHHEELGKLLAENVSSSSSKNSQQLKQQLLTNGATAGEGLQQMDELLQNIKTNLPDIARAVKKELKGCVDGSRMDFAYDLCRVPSESKRRQLLSSHGVPPYLIRKLNSGFGSMMPVQAVDSLLQRNIELAEVDLQEQRKYLDHCMRRVDSLTTSVALNLGIAHND